MKINSHPLSCAKYLTDRTHCKKCKCKSQTIAQSVKDRGNKLVFRSKRLSPSKDNAVNGYKRKEQAQTVVQCGDIAFHKKFDKRYKACDYNDERGQAHRLGDNVFQQ